MVACVVWEVALLRLKIEKLKPVMLVFQSIKFISNQCIYLHVKKNNSNNNKKKKQEKIKLSFMLIYFYFCKLAWYVYRSIKVKTMLQQGKLQLIEIC